MGKIEAPKTISRYTLVMTLQRQYNGNSPFVIKKNGKEVYDFQTDKREFTCCNNMEHKHFMTPLKMWQLVYIYGSNPGPLCNPKGLREKKKDKGSFGQEDGSIISETKKYLESSDPTETAKRISEVQLEIEEEKRKIKDYLNYLIQKININWVWVLIFLICIQRFSKNTVLNFFI